MILSVIRLRIHPELRANLSRTIPPSWSTVSGQNWRSATIVIQFDHENDGNPNIMAVGDDQAPASKAQTGNIQRSPTLSRPKKLFLTDTIRRASYLSAGRAHH